MAMKSACGRLTTCIRWRAACSAPERAPRCNGIPAKNAGFSTAEKDDLYLPLDPDENRPNVAQEEQDPNSILNFVKEIIALRKENPALGNTADFRILFAQENTYPLVYEREGSGKS